MPGKDSPIGRQSRISLGVLAVLLAVAFAILGGAESHAAVLDPRPNVVVVMTDDMNLADLAKMPHTRELIGDRGVSFDRFYVSYPLCCPSRATFLTGRYAHSNHVRENNNLRDGTTGGYYSLDSENALPVWMHDAGYTTGHIGKYLNGYGTRDPQEEPPGWDEWASSPGGNTYKVYDYDLNHNGFIEHHGAAAADYKTTVETSLADSFIRVRALPNQPFFLSLAPLAPHRDVSSPGDPAVSTTPAPEDIDTFAGLSIPRPPSFNEADLSDKPRYMHGLAKAKGETLEVLRRTYRRRLESLQATDRMVAAVVGALTDRGDLDNTYIVFTSDNGFLLGEHRIRYAKVTPYEESIHMPLLVRGPGVPEGEHRSQLTGNVDLAPTIAAIAGATPSKAPDGISLLPLLSGDSGPSRSILLESWFRQTEARFRGLRTGDLAYAEYRSGERELYNLSRDPYELTNLAARRGQRQRVARLHRLLERLRSCHAESCQGGAPKI
ncbi:MAG: N-acetylglucosamine-6-sulfatase [Solirubrobacterales bacterium]|nr:N-acetylglucosamine-6-sulfatase [Solirubrobacterales bacterium]MDX6651584.1 N-acetylglucosamine-6-sulfatase [Solirubrobacterales bacterium]MDX6662347.1 N-acetylglucosamine-6-sulfatase [Solirubrobacterales bacterium]